MWMRIILGATLLVLLAWLGLDVRMGGSRAMRINAALRQGTLAKLDPEEAARVAREVAWLSGKAGVHDVVVNRPFEPGSADVRPLQVFVSDALGFPDSVALTRCGPGNAIFDRGLKAIFIDAALLRNDEFVPVFEASGVGSTVSMSDVPFHRLFFQFVFLHELGHFLKHSHAAAFFDMGGGSSALSAPLRKIEDEADSFALEVLASAYEEQVGSSEGLAAFGNLDRLDLREPAGMPPREMAAAEIAAALMAEGFMKVFMAPNYGSYFEDRAHANLFLRTGSLYERLNERRRSGVDQTLSTVERLVALKSVPESSMRIVELDLPWPIGAGILTSDGVVLTNAEARIAAEVSVAPASRVSSRGLDSTLVVSGEWNFVKCWQKRLWLGGSCLSALKPTPTAGAAEPAPSREWLLRARMHRSDDRFVKVFEGPVSRALHQSHKADEVWTIRASDDSAWQVDGRRLAQVATKNLGVHDIKLWDRQLSGDGAVFTVSSKGSVGGPDLAIITAFRDGREPAFMDLRPFASDIAGRAVTLVNAGKVRQFSWRVSEDGTNASHMWEIVELRADGTMATVASIPSAALRAGERFSQDIERAFGTRITGMHAIPPSTLLVSSEMDGLFKLDLNEKPASPRLVFPFGYEDLRLSFWLDGRILLYMEGGNRAFALLP